MRNNRVDMTLSAFAVICSAICSAIPAAAQIDLSWYTIDGGGATLTSADGGWELSGTVGQPDAGFPLTGGGFELVGGFWAGVSAPALAPCPGDVNGDRIVDLADLTALLAHFGVHSGATPTDGDLDSDADVDLSDLTLLLSAFGTRCP